jgi:hypothetical protein
MLIGLFYLAIHIIVAGAVLILVNMAWEAHQAPTAPPPPPRVWVQPHLVPVEPGVWRAGDQEFKWDGRV